MITAMVVMLIRRTVSSDSNDTKNNTKYDSNENANQFQADSLQVGAPIQYKLPLQGSCKADEAV